MKKSKDESDQYCRMTLTKLYPEVRDVLKIMAASDRTDPSLIINVLVKATFPVAVGRARRLLAKGRRK